MIQQQPGGAGARAGGRSRKGHREPRAPPEPGSGRPGRGGGAGGGGILPFLLFGELRLLRALARSSSIAAAISGLSSPLYQTRSSSPGAIGCGERRDRRRANQSGGCWRGQGGAASRGPARQEGLPNPRRLRVGRPREGTLCWREDLTSRPPPLLGVRAATKDLTRRDCFKLKTAMLPNLTVQSLATTHAEGRIKHGTILTMKSS